MQKTRLTSAFPVSPSGQGRLRDFRRKPPFVGVCECCKEKKTVETIRLPKEGPSGLYLFEKRQRDYCRSCIENLPGRNRYKLVELTGEELEKKTKAIEYNQATETKTPEEKTQSRTRIAMPSRSARKVAHRSKAL